MISLYSLKVQIFRFLSLLFLLLLHVRGMLRTFQASKMQFFAKIVSSRKLVIIFAKSSILDV